MYIHIIYIGLFISIAKSLTMLLRAPTVFRDAIFVILSRDPAYLSLFVSVPFLNYVAAVEKKNGQESYRDHFAHLLIAPSGLVCAEK